MSQPLYFILGVNREQLAGMDPMQTKINRALLAERGLAGVFADVTDRECVAFELHETPGGKAGCMLYYKTAAGRDPLVTTYKPTSQDWHDVGKGVWIGVEKDSPPTPEDLRRRKLISGAEWELGGRVYTIPIIRRYDGTTELPRSMIWDATGNVVEPIRPEYQDRWERAGQIADWLFSGGWKDEFKPKALAHAVDVIGLNYRFDRAEQNILRIVDIDNLFLILGQAVDYSRSMEMVESQKKTASLVLTENSTHGQQAG